MPKITKPEKRLVETDYVNAIREAVARMDDVRLFRNNTGVLRDRGGAYVRYGLAEGSADLIGCVSVMANVVRASLPAPSMTSFRVARFLAIEVKQPGKKPTEHQSRWLDMMQEQGAIVGVAVHVEDAVQIIEEGKRWLR